MVQRYVKIVTDKATMKDRVQLKEGVAMPDRPTEYLNCASLRSQSNPVMR